MSDIHSPYVTVTFGMSGFFAILVKWDEDGEFYDIYNTGMGRYLTGDEANMEAKQWADAEGIEYTPAYKGDTYEAQVKKDREKAKEFRKKLTRGN